MKRVLSLVVVSAIAFLAGWAALHHGFYARGQIVDTPVYQRYGDAMRDGQVPYRDFRPEYPPGALPVFLLPSLVADEPELSYARIFGWLMAACGAAVVVLVGTTLVSLGAGPGRLAAALGFAALWPLALGSVSLTRFDLWPAALTAGSLAALAAGRVRLGSGVLAAAVAAKLFPAVLVPLAAAWIWRTRGPRAAAACGGIFLAVLAAVFVPFAALGTDGLSASFGRQLSRPLQIESLGAAVLVALHHVAGLHVETSTGHGSQNISGSLGDAIAAASTAVQLAALTAVWVVFARGPMSVERLLRFAALALVVFVAFGKVLSPQFLIWLVPVVPLVAGRRGVAAAGLLSAALVVTQVWFPYRYWDYALGFDGTVTALVLARDLALVGLAVLLSRPGREPLGKRAPALPRRIRPGGPPA